MPELAEVETVRRVLINWVKDKKIMNIDCFYQPILENTNINELKEKLINKRIDDIKRHGKHLIFFIGDYCLLSHLRMEGKYFYYKDKSYLTKHNHLIMSLDDNTYLAYNDTRKFGRFNLCKKEDLYRNSIIASLGKEPFDMSGEELFDKSKNYKGTLKEFLLDQHVMAGLGNIYVDEVCFSTHLLPYLKASSLTLEDCKNIINSSIEVLNRAINAGGSSVHSFTSGNGVDGRFQNELNVYGRENKECKICHHALVKTLITSRSTVFCPYCQSNLNINKPEVIGISGLIASGKSYVLNKIKEYGYKIVNCDELVNDLYNDENFKNILNNNFNLSSKDEIRQIVKNDKEKLKLLENLIHPLIINKIKEIIKNNNYVAIEASQLYESKLNKLTGFNIFVVCDEAVRISRLRKRNPLNYQDFKKLNNDISESYKKIKISDYVINTSLGENNVDLQISDMFKKFK